MGNQQSVAREQAVEIQRAYYARTAAEYDEMHVREDDEHGFALSFMIAAVQQFGFESVLDVGSGTGRGLLRMKRALPGLRAVGVEPSAELRAVGHSKGLAEDELIGGDAMNLAFADGSFDLVCEFGALHHISRPSRAVGEMLRVARKGVFISDSNNFAQGGRLARAIKQTVNAVGLWPLADWVKTKGKGYSISEGDGLFYSYSVFNDLPQIARACQSVHFLNTQNSGPNIYRTASHAALLGLKEKTLRMS